MFAVAIDLGTTTLAASLVNIDNGRRMDLAGSLNPQRSFGADVIARLDAAVKSEDSLRQMSQLIRDELWRLVDTLCKSNGLAWKDVSQIGIAGNPAMQHILLGLPVRTLAFPPFRPLHTHGRQIKGGDLGWETSAAVHVFPMPGGFVGGDMVAFLHGQAGSWGETALPALFLDMGTNGEMALLDGDAAWATSAAAGPAFEGGNLSCGMAALPGAINSVRLEGERVHCTVIGDIPPLGICGSAAIEAVCELLDQGLVEATGRLRDSTEIASNLATRIISHNNENAFVLYRDARHLLLLTQSDIRQIQLAKGALRAGLEVLCERSRLRCEALRTVVLTGSFGAVLRRNGSKHLEFLIQPWYILPVSRPRVRSRVSSGPCSIRKAFPVSNALLNDCG